MDLKVDGLSSRTSEASVKATPQLSRTAAERRRTRDEEREPAMAAVSVKSVSEREREGNYSIESTET